MALNPKETLFGGLPHSTFNSLVAKLQGLATCPGAGPAAPEVQAALSVLVALAKCEHAAATSTVDVQQIAVAMKTFYIDQDVQKLTAASQQPGQTIGALTGLQSNLDDLADLWNGV